MKGLALLKSVQHPRFVLELASIYFSQAELISVTDHQFQIPLSNVLLTDANLDNTVCGSMYAHVLECGYKVFFMTIVFQCHMKPNLKLFLADVYILQ